jgi:hypothetical protein
MPYDPRCRKCGNPLLTEDETEYMLCEDCSESAYAASEERRDFDYWHPPE